MWLKLFRLVSRFVLRLIADVEVIGYENLPKMGGCIAASNHLGRLDPILGYILTDRDDIVMFVAEKYQKYAVFRWLGRRVDAVWLNRYQTDFRALRLAQKRLRQGELLPMAPEGTRSHTGALIEGKGGAAYLAAKTGVPIVPVGVTGTGDREIIWRLRRLQRLHITVHAGEPFTLPSLDRKNRSASLQEYTDEVMCRIAALLPPSHRGVYAHHPRLQELLETADGGSEMPEGESITPDGEKA
jgi:1-acyl-sn-glycerol-3-phosphate acyltransferase